MAPRPTPPVKLYYRIGEVADVVGVEPHVLRYWESEFGTIRPQKSPKGQRVYSRKDLEKLLKVKELLYGQGYTIAGAKKRLREMGGTTKGGDVVSESSAHEASRVIPPIAHGFDETPLRRDESPAVPVGKATKSDSSERARAHFSLEAFEAGPVSRGSLGVRPLGVGAHGIKLGSERVALREPTFEVKSGGTFSFVVEGDDESSPFESKGGETSLGERSIESELAAGRSVWSGLAEPPASSSKIPDLFSSERGSERFEAAPSLFDIALLEAEGSNFDDAGGEAKGPAFGATRPHHEARSGGSLKSELVELRQRIVSELAFLSHSSFSSVARRREGR